MAYFCGAGTALNMSRVRRYKDHDMAYIVRILIDFQMQILWTSRWTAHLKSPS